MTDIRELLRSAAPPPRAALDVHAVLVEARRRSWRHRMRGCFAAAAALLMIGTGGARVLAPADDATVEMPPAPEQQEEPAPVERQDFLVPGRGEAGQWATAPEAFATSGRHGSPPPAVHERAEQERSGGGSFSGPELAYTQGDTIYVANTDGSGARAVAKGLGPDWSPDGRKIAFWRTDGAPDGCRYSPEDRASCRGVIWVADADGSNAVAIGQGQEPDWSPDGRRLAFRAGVAPNFDIYTMSADGTDVRPVTSTDLPEFDPDWSPDGTKIAFIRLDSRSGEFLSSMYIANVDGRSETRVVYPPYGGGRPVAPAWSPDGTKIAYAGLGDHGFDIWVMNGDGSDKVRLTSGPESCNLLQDFDADPAWSSDGQRILFTHDPDGPENVFISASVNRCVHSGRTSQGGPAGWEIHSIGLDGSQRRRAISGGTAPAIRR